MIFGLKFRHKPVSVSRNRGSIKDRES